MHKYQLQEQIGRGSYSAVYRALNLQTGQQVAIKHAECKFPKGKHKITNQISILNRFKKHPNIVSLLQVIANNKEQYFLVFEYHPMTLIGHYKAFQVYFHTCLPELQIKSFLYQITMALDFLHSNQIMHRDIKPENILLSGSLVKLIDFGIAKKNEFGKNTEYVSTRWYRSPEVLLGLPYSFSSDIFGLGCVMLELYHSEEIFRGASTLDQIYQISDFIDDFDKWPDGLQKIRSLGLQLKRPGWKKAQILSKIPSTLGRELACQMLTFNPYKRIRTQDILRHPYFKDVILPKEVNEWAQARRSEKISIGLPNERTRGHPQFPPERSQRNSTEPIRADLKLATKRTHSVANFIEKSPLGPKSQENMNKIQSQPRLQSPRPSHQYRDKPKKISLREKRCVYGLG